MCSFLLVNTGELWLWRSLLEHIDKKEGGWERGRWGGWEEGCEQELVIGCFITIHCMASGVLGQGNGEVCISGLSSLPRHIAGPLTGPPGQRWSAWPLHHDYQMRGGNLTGPSQEICSGHWRLGSACRPGCPSQFPCLNLQWNDPIDGWIDRAFSKIPKTCHNQCLPTRDTRLGMQA